MDIGPIKRVWEVEPVEAPAEPAWIEPAPSEPEPSAPPDPEPSEPVEPSERDRTFGASPRARAGTHRPRSASRLSSAERVQGGAPVAS